ncbi:MAG TPA: division/cell wall cluster transcriptional repressor MraZ [Thermoanaerobaculia bacterium]|jgi:MraZ protein
MFRGSAATKIDEKGRLKVPSEFRRILEERYGTEVFITSITGDSATLYPLPVWEEIEQRLSLVASTNRARQRFLERVNYFGQQLRLDGQGRVVVPQILREQAEMVGDVVVSGRIEHLEIWNRERFDRKLGEEPFTEDDYRALADLGV